MTRTNVDYAKDEINELVDGMASGNPERPQEIKAGLMKIVSDRTFAAAAEAACFWIGHWRMVADMLEVMAQRSQDARVGDRERLDSLRGRAKQLQGNASDLENALLEVT
jgi:hypothetical protein